MSVYVDPPRWPFRGQLYCHVWADSLAELHAAADRVGLKRAWFQTPPKASWSHYDCAPRLRAMLVLHGAIETDSFGAAEHEARRRGNAKLLARIVEARARRAASRVPPVESLPLFREAAP